jgi:5'/3'-nucleotidase
MRILLTNDDGIHAPGLAVLERVAAKLSDDVWVVAPETEQSGASHSLSLHHPLRLRPVGHQRYAAFGTPTDCVALGVLEVLKDKRPDLVLSGVNRGANIADDVTYSGTVAGAMEGTVLGVPSIALSQAYASGPDRHTPWDTAEHHAPDLIRRLVACGWPAEVLINVNFPEVAPDAVTGIEVTVMGRRDQSLLYIDARVDTRQVPYYWLGFKRRSGTPGAGTDMKAMERGAISVTPLHLDLTHREALRDIRAALTRD